MFVLRWHIMLLKHEINKKRKALAQSSKHGPDTTPKLTKHNLKNDPICKDPPKRKKNILVDPFDALSDSKFIETYGLRKQSVKDLIEELRPYLPNPRRSDGIRIQTRVLIALSFYVSGLYQKNLGQNSLLHASQKTVSRSVSLVTDALNMRLSNHIKWPMQTADREEIKARFHEKFQFPDVLGCLDGMQVTIIKPHIQEERFQNKEGCHSINVMIISDADLNILCVDPSSPGSVDHSIIWKDHEINERMNQVVDSGEETYLLGDSKYQQSKTLLTPIKHAESSSEHCHNLKHVTAHNTVKTCINILKARFRCLVTAHPLHYDPVSAGKIVNACCILHNIAVATDTPLPHQSMIDLKSDLILQQMEESYRKPKMYDAVSQDSMDDSIEDLPDDISDNTSNEDQKPDVILLQRLWENRE